VRQLELGEHDGDAFGLARVGRLRAAGGHVAKLTRTRADAAEDHDGQRPPVPALADVGARRALAHRVEAQLGHALAQVEEHLAGGHLHADPGGLGLHPLAHGHVRLAAGRGAGGGCFLGPQDAQPARAGFDDTFGHGGRG
jgi:hypothetical protein